jgi:hypothetical protein
MMGSQERIESSTAVERRGAERFSYRELVWFKLVEYKDEQAGDSVEGVSRSCDVSTGGLGLISSHPMPEGQNIFLEISGKGFEFSATGQVVYSRPIERNIHRVGVRFSALPPGNRIDLDRLISSCGSVL